MTKDGSDREASVRRVSGRLHAAPIGSSKAPPCSDAAALLSMKVRAQRFREITSRSESHSGESGGRASRGRCRVVPDGPRGVAFRVTVRDRRMGGEQRIRFGRRKVEW